MTDYNKWDKIVAELSDDEEERAPAAETVGRPSQILGPLPVTSCVENREILSRCEVEGRRIGCFRLQLKLIPKWIERTQYSVTLY